MNRHPSLFLFVTGLALVFCTSSCKVKRKVVDNRKASKETIEIVTALKNNELEYSTFELRGSTKTDIVGGTKYVFNLIYRNKLDSLLWMSARAMFGIEAARLIANKDSVWIISRLARIEEKNDWLGFSKMIGYPLDFHTLQALLTRKIFMPQAQSELLQNMNSVDADQGRMLVPDYNDGEQRELLSRIGFLPHFQLNDRGTNLVKTKLVPEEGNWLLEVMYGEEGIVEFFGLPSRIAVSALDENENYQLDVKVLHVKVNQELRYPFPWF